MVGDSSAPDMIVIVPVCPSVTIVSAHILCWLARAGHHHLEEMMWREELTRQQVVTVLKCYSDIVLCCTHAEEWAEHA